MSADRSKAYLLAVLMTVLAFNSVDRLALGLVLQDLKRDLSLSDSELGFLGGIAFTLFYSLMGIPIARWADRGNRIIIIAGTTTLWSVMVAMYGLATNFWQLFVLRVGTAVGESGCTPPALSLIADRFGPVERPRAIARYLLGGSLSVVVGYFVAGWLNEYVGWRLTFLLLGLPGIVPAALAIFTLRDPRTSQAPNRARTAISRADDSMVGVFKTLWRIPTLRYLLAAFAVSAFFFSGIMQWQPTFFIRTYGFKTGELGTWLSLIYGVGGMLGLYLGGTLASHRFADGERGQLRLLTIIYTVVAAVSPVIYLSANQYMSFGLLALTTIAQATINAPLFAAILALVPERTRATAVSLIYLVANLIGVGLGPWAAGVASDALHAWAGSNSLRYTLLSMCPGYLFVGLMLLKGSSTVTSDLKNAAREVHCANEFHDDHAVTCGPGEAG